MKKQFCLILHPSSFILSQGGIFLLHFPCPSFAPFPKADELRTVGVTHHRVLWSPDFPLPGPSPRTPRRLDGFPSNDRPADP